MGQLPWPLLAALIFIKKGAAIVNGELGTIPREVSAALVQSADELLRDRAQEHFPLSPFQTGSGTSTNMNVNEVLANRANEVLGGLRGAKSPVHPNDHVNRCQSSNDVFPSAIHVASLREIRERLVPAATALRSVLWAKALEFAPVLKLGRTHLMDALPVTLGQELGAYARQVELGVDRVTTASAGMLELPLGGTAVGTGVNAHPKFAPMVIEWLVAESGLPFVRASDAFEAQGARDACVAASGGLRGFAVSLSKIANDLRWMASGPNGALGEIRLPALQPGSSIMPGKVNPVVPEVVLQACAQVLADDCAVAQGGLGGVLELNLMMPLIAKNLLEEVDLLSQACRLLAERCVVGLEAVPGRCRSLLESSLALVTPLAEVIGYEAAARVASFAKENGISLIDAATRLRVASEETVRRLLDPVGMAGGGGAGPNAPPA